MTFVRKCQSHLKCVRIESFDFQLLFCSHMHIWCLARARMRPKEMRVWMGIERESGGKVREGKSWKGKLEQSKNWPMKWIEREAKRWNPKKKKPTKLNIFSWVISSQESDRGYSYLIAIKGDDFRQLHVKHLSSVAFHVAPTDLFINMCIWVTSRRLAALLAHRLRPTHCVFVVMTTPLHSPAQPNKTFT